MPEILPDHVPSPRTPLVWDGTRYRAVRGHTDGTVQVRGEDQLFSYEDALARQRIGIISGANGYFDSHTPPGGEVWVITNVMSMVVATATTVHGYNHHRGAAVYDFAEDRRAIAAGQLGFYHGWVCLEGGDTVRVYFTGGLLGDQCYVNIVGYSMHKE